MVRSVDGVVSHFRTLKAKLVLLLFERKIREIKQFREQLQGKVDNSALYKGVQTNFFIDHFRLESLLISLELKSSRISSKQELFRGRKFLRIEDKARNWRRSSLF